MDELTWIETRGKNVTKDDTWDRRRKVLKNRRKERIVIAQIIKTHNRTNDRYRRRLSLNSNHVF